MTLETIAALSDDSIVEWPAVAPSTSSVRARRYADAPRPPRAIEARPSQHTFDTIARAGAGSRSPMRRRKIMCERVMDRRHLT
jgi:hypothetical protein